MIEAPLLLSDVGAAVTLLNWSGSDVQSLKMTVRLPFVVKSVESVQKGKLAFQQTADGITFSLPMGAADIIKLYK